MRSIPLTLSPKPSMSTSPSSTSSTTTPPPDSAHSASGKVGVRKRVSVGKLNGHSTTGTTEAPNGVSTHKPEKTKKIDWEIPRKSLHSSIGFATLALYTQNVNVLIPIIGLSAALPIVLLADYVRLRNPRFAKTYEKRLGFLMRESEKHKVNGVVWYLIGTVFVLTLYPTDVAVVSILILSWADTAASTLGRAYGRYTPPLPDRVPFLSFPIAPRKSLAGFVSAWLTGSLIAFTFWATSPEKLSSTFTFSDGVSATAYHLGRANPTMTWNWTQHGGWIGLLALTVWSGMVTAVSEALDLGEVLDDNITLPILSGGLIWGFISLLKAIT